MVKESFPEIHLICSSKRLYCGSARNRGVSQSRGDIIAFIDSDCLAAENWINSIIKAHERSDPIIGGVIGNAVPSNIVGWASYFCEFSQWMPGTSARSMGDVAGANMSYKREVFRQLGSFLENTYSSDTEFHWRFIKEGQAIHFNPDIKVYHKSIRNLFHYLRHEFQHGRAFARVRTGYWRFSRLRRIAYSLLFGFISVKLFIEISFRVLRKRTYVVNWLKSSPLLFAGLAVWSLGEAAGYLTDY